MTVQFHSLSYEQLSKAQLYDVLALRSQVFVLEQCCHYQDLDRLDQQAQHVLATDGDNIIGCARILPPSSKSAYPSIGRYALHAEYRGKGAGRRLFAYAIDSAKALFPKQPLYIQAQYYLKEFYASFGFVPEGDVYKDAGIDHVDMVLLYG